MSKPIKLSDVQSNSQDSDLYYTDEQFVAIPANESVSDHYNQVTQWCDSNDVDAKFIGTWMIADDINQYSLWIVEDSYQMTIFKLRWS